MHVMHIRVDYWNINSAKVHHFQVHTAVPRYRILPANICLSRITVCMVNPNHRMTDPDATSLLSASERDFLCSVLCLYMNERTCFCLVVARDKNVLISSVTCDRPEIYRD